MNHEIKLIGLDLDGTVFNEDKIITKHTIDVIKSAIQSGILVIPATGRPVNGLPKEFTSIPGVRYAVTANGASVVDLETNDILYSDCLSQENSIKIMNAVAPFPSIIDIFIKGTGYTNKEQLNHLEQYISSLPLIEYIKSTRKTFDSNYSDFILARNETVEKIHMLFHDLKVKAAVLDVLKHLPYITITSAIPNNLEINSATANKGTGLLKLGEMLSIRPEEIMSCGDNGNDLAMIKAAGFGVAMGNATDEVKAAADYITKTNEEDGVAYVIEQILNGLIIT